MKEGEEHVIIISNSEWLSSVLDAWMREWVSEWAQIL